MCDGGFLGMGGLIRCRGASLAAGTGLGRDTVRALHSRLLVAWLCCGCLLVLALSLGRVFAQSTPTADERMGEPAPLGEHWPPLRDLSDLEYSGMWEYNWGDSPRDALGRLVYSLAESPSKDWTPVGRYDLPKGRNGRRWLWLRTELPVGNYKDPVLQLSHLDQELQVFVEGKLVYEWGDFSRDAQPFLGYRGHIVRLPPSCSGQRLAMRIYSEHVNIGPAGPIRFGEHHAILEHLFRSELPRIFVGGLQIFLATMGFVLFWLRKEERVFLFYGVLAGSGGIYILVQSPARQLLFDYPLVFTYVELWSLQITTLALCHFVEAMFGAGPLRVLYYLRQVQWVYLFGSAIVVALGWVPVLKTLLPVQVMLLADFAMAMALPLYYSFRGNVEGRIFATGFLGAGVIAVYDVLVAVGVLSRAHAKLGHIGYALFFVTLGAILARRVLRASQRLQNYTSILNLSLASSRVLVPDERAQVALSELVRLLAARRALLFLLGEKTEQLEFATGRSSDGQSLAQADNCDAAFVQQSLLTQKPAVRRTAGKKIVQMVAPLTARGQKLGVLYIESDNKRQGLSEEDLDVLIGLAHQVAISILSARTLRIEIDAAMAQKRMQEQQTLLDAAVRMAAGDLSTPVTVPAGSAMTHLAEALESMRTDLLAKVLEMENKGREVQTLNEELRRQIAERSRRLMSVIYRSKAGKTTPLPDLSPGKVVVGRYKVVRKIGEGAMGVVHEVERISDGRHLAAKFVPQLSDKKSLLRFMREAQILARLRHPNLIGITDVDMTAGGILFMIMDLVVGGSLKSARRRFGEVRWAMCVLRQIAEALAAIHAAGIVHRDLKPDNVLLAGGEESALPFVKLADFGVSLLMSKAQASPLSRAKTLQLQASVDPLEESTEMQVPGADWNDNDDGEFDMAEDGFADTANIPTRPAAARAGALARSRQASTDENAVTLQIGPDGQATALGGSPAGAAGNRGGSARKPSSPDSLAAHAETTGSGIQDSVTQSGILIGTPMYMAPELWHSGSHLAQPSSDLFSFGVIGFELLTSVLPFLKPPVFAHAQKQPMRIATLATSRTDLPPKLSALVDGCLSENPADRPSARAVLEQLRELGAPTPTQKSD